MSSSTNGTMIKEEQVQADETVPIKPTKKATADDGALAFKLLLLTLMVVQNSATVLLGRYTRSTGSKEELFLVSHLVLITEFGKFVISCVLEYVATNGALMKSFKENIFDRPMDALKISIPSLLYLVQNTLLYLALSNLSAPLFQVTYQAKLVTTAIVSVLMLGRSYNVKQWICLVGLSMGVAIVVLGESKPKEEETKTAQSLTVGMVAVTVACFCSALAGVYFEKVLKHSTTDKEGAALAPVSVWMRNCQLALFSCVIAVFQQVASPPVEGSAGKPYLHGFTAWVWVLVALQAGGGLLVAAVIKYADNVLKGLATGVSVVSATGASMILFGTPLSHQFTVGAIMILASVYFFANDLPSACVPSSFKTTTTKKEDSELEAKLLPK